MSKSSAINPKANRCVAIDLGAGSGRVVVGHLQDAQIKLIEVGRFKTPMLVDDSTGYQCWDTQQILTEIRRHLSFGTALGVLASVGIDSWAVDYVLLDAQKRMVGLPISYRDKRTDGVMERVQKDISRAEIYRRTGIQCLPFNTLYQLAASVAQQPLWMKEAEYLLMIPDYLHFLISGIMSNEYTNATTTQMCGLDGCWDESLMEAIGLKRSLAQNPIPAATILGEARGFSPGLKVIAPATHDTASAVAGTPLENSAEAYISSGTWSLMGIESMTPIASAAACEMNFSNEGGLERRFRILKNIMGMWPIQRLCEEHKIADVGMLVRQAGDVEPWQSIVVIDDREFLHPASMTEAIQDYCRRTRQRVPQTVAALARCVFDSLALSYKVVLQQLEALREAKLEKIRIVGGGCQNEMLNQLCADVCELPVIAGPVEASALGNVIAQFIALGLIENLDAGRALIRASCEMKEYLPRTPIPNRVHEQFHQLLVTSRPIVAEP